MKNKGFTLIELVVVIVILGIMTAIAVPKFVDLQSEARRSVMQGVEGSVRSAAALAYSKALINNQTGATGVITVNGATISLTNGYPDANPTAPAGGIVDLVDLTGAANVTYTAGTPGVFSYTGTTTCTVTYTDAASSVAPATVTSDYSNC